MLEYTWAKTHAALNDLPAAFLLAAVLFDLAGWALKRQTLRAVGVWSLWAGVVGGWLAYVAGQMAEDSIDHGQQIHELMERHEDLALYTMVLFTALLAWKLWRKGQLSPVEDTIARLFGLAGLALLLVTGVVGGQAVFDHAAGVTNDAMVSELEDRGVEMPSAAPADSAKAPATGHQHAPGTPQHEH